MVRVMNLPLRTLAAGGLATASALHGIWATGSSFPAKSRERLADHVLGDRAMPPNWLTGVVASALGGAAAVTHRASQAPDSPRSRLAARGVAGTLALRAVFGFVASGLKLGSASPTYRRWDLALYSPLCVALAAGTAAAARTPTTQ